MLQFKMFWVLYCSWFFGCRSDLRFIKKRTWCCCFFSLVNFQSINCQKKSRIVLSIQNIFYRFSKLHSFFKHLNREIVGEKQAQISSRVEIFWMIFQTNSHRLKMYLFHWKVMYRRKRWIERWKAGSCNQHISARCDNMSMMHGYGISFKR